MSEQDQADRAEAARLRKRIKELEEEVEILKRFTAYWSRTRAGDEGRGLYSVWRTQVRGIAVDEHERGMLLLVLPEVQLAARMSWKKADVESSRGSAQVIKNLCRMT